MKTRTLVLGLLTGLLGFATAAALSAPAAAVINITGDWVITGSDWYANETINVTATNNTTGNILVAPGADLHLENVTLLVPFNRTLDNQGYLEVRNSTLQGPNWFFYLRGAADIRATNIVSASHSVGGGFSGTYVSNSSVSFGGVNWYNGAGNTRSWTIHLRVAIDFKDNTLGARGQLRYELPSISRTLGIEVANNVFAMGTGFAATTALVIENALHTGTVTYDIHHNNITNGDDGIYFGSSSLTTTFLIHDSTFSGMFSSAVEVGQGAAVDDFGGNLRIWNVSISNVFRGIRVFGVPGAGLGGTIDNATIGTTGIGIVANDYTWAVSNSLMGFNSSTTQYRAESGGRVVVYNTTDLALNGETTAAGASVEHFVFLNVLGATWQGGVAILGDLVALREAAGNVSLLLDPQNWTPREIVWWGVYFGAPQVDNRDLRPVIVDGPRTFPCAPSPFLVTDDMGPLGVVCTDDSPPAVAISRPTLNWIQNWPDASADGSGSEYGAGVDTFDWSLDNASWLPLSPSGASPFNWSFEIPSLPDGPYTVYLRLADRTGNVAFASRGPFTIDTEAPTLSLPGLSAFASGTTLDLSGTTEPLAAVSYRTAAGATGATSAAADGSFDFLAIPLEEGFNNITITSADRAGNQATLQATIMVDSVPPAIVVFQEAVLYTKEPGADFAGLTEEAAVVRANSVLAARTGDGFSFTLALAAGLNTVTVTATDAAGNTVSWFGAVWYDADLPSLSASVTTAGVADDGTPVTRTGTVSASGTLGDATTRVVTLTVNGEHKAFDGSGAFFFTLNVSDGLNTFVVSATDMVGNVRSVTLRVLRDSGAPSAQASLREADAPLLTVETSVYTRGSFVLVELSMSEDGVATVQGETRAVIEGPNTFNVSLHDGTNTISISFRDRAGNLGIPSTLGIVRDTQGPLVAINSPPTGAVVEEARIQVSGVSEVGARVTVNGDVVAVSPGGGFSAAVDVLAGTSTTITVVATDAVGNQNTTSVTISRRAASVTTAPSADLSVAVALLVGVAAGVGIGFMVRGRSTSPGRDDESLATEPSGAARGAPGTGPAAPAPEHSQKGPKGPRGPQPPDG